MFQEIRNTLGQKAPNSEYQAKTKVTAIIQRVKNVEYSKTSGKPGQSLLIQAGGEEEWIKLIGKFDALDASFEGRSFDFLIWPFQPDSSPKSYLYAWIQRQSGAQTPPQVGQGTQGQNMDIGAAKAKCDQIIYEINSLRAWIASMGQQAPLPQTTPQQQAPPQAQGGQPNPNYDENYQSPDDDLPF